MPAKLKSNRGPALAHARERMAHVLNLARDQQLNYADFRAPVKNGRLRKTIRGAGDATPENLRAFAKVGGQEVDGVLVDYADDVNFGHATADGGHVPADPFWTESEEVGANFLRMQTGKPVKIERGSNGG